MKELRQDQRRTSPTFADKVECHWNGSIHFVDPVIFQEMLFLQGKGAKRFMREDEAAEMFGVCKNNIKKIAKAADGYHRIDGTTFIDLEAVNRYIELS